MARPRSDDKRNAILAAAVEVIAEQGLGAPTARIAKLARVAEGTLFTYFSNKDELLNQLYLELKLEMRDVMLAAYPRSKSVKERVRHIWQRYVDWGVGHPHQRKALAQLAVSERISGKTRTAAEQAMGELGTILDESIAAGMLHDYPRDFVAAVLGSLAETSIAFMAREPAQAQRYSALGFEVFWHAVARK
jgi:AcrR family transcriptional regulator